MARAWVAFAVLVLALEPYAYSSNTSVPLSSLCPPSFEKLKDETCVLRTLYDLYDSPDQHGGVQAELPELQSRFTPQKIDLGRYLFFDPLLSAKRDMSCASCHQIDKGLADGMPTSLGAQIGSSERTKLNRSTPTLWNVAFLKQFMWDGRATTLIEQAKLPLLSQDEMGNTEEGIVRAVSASANYRDMFQEAFGAPPTLDHIAEALAAFQTSLVSFNSRYDQYAHGNSSALAPNEIRGYNVFRGFVARCSQCHVPPLFTDSELAVVGAPVSDDGYLDRGAGEVSDDPFKNGAFRVPTLRNITLTAPYFHNGKFKDLKEVVTFYNDTRGHQAPKNQDLRIHWHVHMTDGPQLNDSDIDDIVSFLGTLNDELLLPKIPDHVPSGLPVTTSMSGEN